MPLPKTTKADAVAALREQKLATVFTFSVPPHYFTEWTRLMRREKMKIILTYSTQFIHLKGSTEGLTSHK